MNKSTKNPREIEQYRINLHEFDPLKFKEAFIESSVFDSVMSLTDLDRLVSLFFRLTIVLSESDDISKETRGDIIQMLEGFHLLGKIVIDAGGADKMEEQALLTAFVDSHIVEYIIDLETLIRLTWDVFILMQCIAYDEVAFDIKQRGAIITRFQSLLFLIQELIKQEFHECESV